MSKKRKRVDEECEAEQNTQEKQQHPKALTNKEWTDFMREKLEKCIKEANGDISKIKIKPGNKLVDQPDGTWKMMMTCVGPCKKDKERVPLNFSKGGDGANWKSSLPGFEYLANSKTHPCNECFNLLKTERRYTEPGKIDKILDTAGIPLEKGRPWVEEQRKKLGDKFFISNLPMNFTTNSEWMPSIQNLNNGFAHNVDTCELIEAEFNVQQHDAIPNIAQAIITIFSLMVIEFIKVQDTSALVYNARKNWISKPKQNGITAKHKLNGKQNPEYTAQINNCHLKRIISMKLKSHIEYDRKKLGKTTEEMEEYKKRFNKTIMDLSFKKLVHEQQLKCSYSHVPMTITNSPQRFSFERIDNNKPHFGPEGDIDNIVFICRIFNSSAGMNRRKMLQCFLSQKHVHLPDFVRIKAKKEYNSLINVIRS